MSGIDMSSVARPRRSAFFLAHLDSRLEPLRPLLRVWAREATRRYDDARDWDWALKPWGIAVLCDIAQDLRWEVEHSCWIGLSDHAGEPWPVGWRRRVEFSLRPSGGSPRWAFAVRRLSVPAGSAIDATGCDTALRSAQRALRRVLLNPMDVGLAVVELRMPLPAGTGDEAADLAQAIDRLHGIRKQLGASGLLLHAVPSGAQDDAYDVRVMASLLAPCGSLTLPRSL